MGGDLERFPFRLTVPRVREVCGAFSTRDFVEASGDGLAKMLDRVGGTPEGVGGDLAQDSLELGEHLFDRVEVGTVCGKVDQNCAACFDGFPHAGDFVNRDIVHERYVTSLERWSQDLFDIGAKGFAVHRTFEHERRGHVVVPQRGDEGRGLPVAVQDLVNQALSARGAAIETGNIARDAGFINENQPLWIKPWLPPSQGSAIGRDVRSILLGGVQAFF